MIAILLIFFLACDAMWARYAWSMPVPAHGEAVFGGSVSAGHPNPREKRILLSYRLVLAVSFTCIEITASVLTAHYWNIPTWPRFAW
jgi:hypothetical protein